MASDHEKQVVVGGGSGGWWDEVEASKAWMIVRMIVSGGSNLAAPLKAGERLEVPSVVEVRAVAGQLQAAVVAKVKVKSSEVASAANMRSVVRAA